VLAPPLPDRHALPRRGLGGMGARARRCAARGGGVRIAVHDSALAAGGRLAHALAGLDERGHVLVLPGASPGSADRAEVDVVVGGAEPRGVAWLAALTGARATVLGLERGRHRAWDGLDRWAWSIAGGYGVIDEREVAAFRAQIPGEDRE